MTAELKELGPLELGPTLAEAVGNDLVVPESQEVGHVR